MTLFDLLLGIALYACASSGDKSIIAALAKSYIRAVVYGVIAIIILVAIILKLFVH